MGRTIDLDDVFKVERDARSRFTHRALVCTSTACLAAGAAGVRATLDDEVAAADAGLEAQVVATGCPGLCSRGPLVSVSSRGEPDTLYQRVDEPGARDIARDHLVGDRVVDGAETIDDDLPFFGRQRRVVLATAGRIDPERLEDYVAEGGYRSLSHVLTLMSPEEVVKTITASGLRGRGGAGYPTGKKWELLRTAPGEHKYVVANGDEGDPGAYMDRTIMDSDPHRVIEGLTIAAYATGADRGYVYVRAEYPLAIERLERGIRDARRAGLLGKRVLDTDFTFNVEVRVGAGAFVCGEETALMASIEGRRGLPRLRPPYPTEHGLWGDPTMINNVETLANVPSIIEHGAEWFTGIGTARSPGTKVFALAGSLVDTGLVEVPMGTSLREIVFDMAGGIPEGRSFKAAQTGGPSGGCLPARFLDTPVDYEHLQELGSMMGSGGMVVMDDTVSMPEVARFYMQFCREESCGKCAPCRVGTVKMLAFLERICDGEGRARDLVHLESLAHTVRATSLCGLGQSAPNPVFSTLDHFRDEYLDLLVEEDLTGGPAQVAARVRPAVDAGGAS